MSKVAQGIARAAQAIFGVSQQVVDLCNQRFELAWHLGVELRALALLQLGDLSTHALKRAQRTGNGDALQHQYQDQGDQTQAQADLLHAPELLAHRGVVLGNADGNGLAEAPVITAQQQQLLILRAQFQIGMQTTGSRCGHLQVPERTGAPGTAVEIDAKVVTGERSLVGRRNTPLIQLKTGLPTHQGDQQVFAFLT
ncbi:hypothetical protein D3C81_1149530 [compost metagenome]